jgi:YesN/AraC family two-component response regulator
MVVRSELDKLGYTPQTVILGEAEILEDLTISEKENVGEKLRLLGFELIDDNNSKIIEKIKTLIINLVHHSDEELKVNLSEYIETHLHKDYTYLSNLFSDTESTTIEKYFIHQKIERVKELLVYDELTLSEIAYKMGYSSVAYLSAQFKKVTGLPPSHFKMIKEIKRKPLDKV